MDPGFRVEWGGRTNVVVTHPLNRTTGCVLRRRIAVPAGGARLEAEVADDPRGDFELVIRVEGEVVERRPISSPEERVEWQTVAVDLGRWAGREVIVELVNRPNGWQSEAAYWSAIRVVPHAAP